MTHTLRYTTFSLLALALLGGGWYFFRSQGRTSGGNAPLPYSPAASQTGGGGDSSQATSVAEAAVAPLVNLYRNVAYGFSFKYPDGLKVGGAPSPDGSATTILVQDIAAHIGFQIYITPFADPDTTITAARVARDLPALAMRGAEIAQVGASSPGLAFLAEDPSFGESRQIWFVYKKHLYQVSAKSSQDALLQRVLATWEFGR
ncbi:hypothetical protein HY972_02055 [Candidatus Kaiserbacteria bacterium]|nr:hypothetical protein [Candidatus Kaiserbacteria bacterium]